MQHATITRAMSGQDWLMLCALSLLWGSSFFFIELAITELPPLTIVWLRVALAAVILWAVAFMLGMSLPRDTRLWASFLGMGLLNNVIPFFLIVWGQSHITSALASILNATTPLFTVLVAGIFLTDEKPTRNKLIGVAIGFLGTVVMIGPTAWQGVEVNLWAQIAVLAAALSYACAGTFGRRFRTLNINPLITAAGQVSASALVLSPIVLYFEPPSALAIPSRQSIMAVLALAILSTALAYVLYFRILASSGATNLLLVTFLIPISAILLGTLILAEALQTQHFFGMAIIALGLLIMDGRWWPRQPN